MGRYKITLGMMILLAVWAACSLLLLGLTFFQVYLLGTCQGLPPLWQQVLFFAILLVAGGVAVLEFSCPRQQL